MKPKFKPGDQCRVSGQALYAEIIRPPAYDCGDYLVKLVYSERVVRTRIYRSHVENNWRLRSDDLDA